VVSSYRSAVAAVAILVCFAIQLVYKDALMLGALVLLAQTAVLSLLGVGGIKAYAKTFISYFVPLAMVFTVVRQRRQVTCIPNGIVVAGGWQFLAWRDISRIEIQPSPVFRLPCLLVHSNTDQPALRINLFLLYKIFEIIYVKHDEFHRKSRMKRPA